MATRTLPLNHRGPKKYNPQLALIDQEDYELVGRLNWSVNADGYAVRWFTLNDGTKKMEYMHRIIMDARPGDPVEIDHINGDRSDNRRSNLRRTDDAGNGANRRGANSNSVTGVRNVFPTKNGRYRVEVSKHRKTYYGGVHDDVRSARIVAETLRARLFGGDSTPT